MGKIGYTAADGKVTAENLTRETVIEGAEVVVKLNGKPVLTVPGQAKRAWCREVRMRGTSVEVDCTGCPEYKTLSAGDFGVGIISTTWNMVDTVISTYGSVVVAGYRNGVLTVNLTLKKYDGADGDTMLIVFRK